MDSQFTEKSFVGRYFLALELPALSNHSLGKTFFVSLALMNSRKESEDVDPPNPVDIS